MSNPNNRPTIGLALSGSGNISSFYIGFLEVINEAGIKIDFISAMSGGALVAACYACGSLPQFKELVMGLDSEKIKQYMVRINSRGGFYSLDNLENQMRIFTKGQSFDQVRPLMSFVTVDIDNGEQVELCMGDIARAARISCTVPGIFEAVKWGNHTLVDGGVLCQVPIAALNKFSPDITIGIDVRTTKHIFLPSLIRSKKIINSLKKFLYIDEALEFLKNLFPADEDIDFPETNNGFYSVVSKGLDLAIEAGKQLPDETKCDILISPDKAEISVKGFNKEKMERFYQQGREKAKQYLPEILEKIKEKEKVKV